MIVEVAELDGMSRTDHLAAWQKLFDEPVPDRLSMPFLRRFLAFEIQTRRYGGVPRSVDRQLQQVVGEKKRPGSARLEPGGRLLREWNGVTHVVDVVEDGFRWNGETHRSLSAIAKRITGAHWSGPRFFGLTRAVGK